MSELQVIQSALEQAARRQRWGRALRGLWYGLLAGASLSLLLIGAYHLWPLPLWVLVVAGLIPLPCLLAGLAIGGWRKPGLPEVARWVDNRQRLKERLSTALEVSAEPSAGVWSELVVTDAASHAKEIDPRKLLPFHLPRFTRWALLILALGAGLGFVPEYRSKSYRQKKADEQNIKEAGRQLAELTRRTLEKRTPALEPTQKSFEMVTNLSERLMNGSVTRSDALKDLASVADQFKDQLRDLGKDAGLKRMEQAARMGSSGSDSQTAATLQKQIEALQKQLGSPTGNPDALDKLKKSLEKLREAAKGFANNQNAVGKEAQRKNLSESLSALSRDAQDLGLQLSELDDAIQALAQNNTDMLLKDLKDATVDLEKMRDMAKSLAQLQQQVEKMGKDLAEQLKNGQAEAAQQTLQKMISQLNSANMSQEQAQKLMNEIAKAVKPAGNYGEVSKHLQAAAQQMQKGDKNGASQSLAKASGELNKLMQQLGDAQDLQATLDALNQASMYIGIGQGWRPGAQGMGTPGATKRNNEPGRGVGTWADDNATWDGQMYNGWDNTGVDRPDEDARGHSDRGEGQLNDALSPTKLKGQFSQGGQMPSITLKGVSIKGTSTRDFEAVAAAAQSDAQSALSQEKVPRAYQGAVKDYFDDLKK